MAAYERLIQETSTPECPWYVVPADNKWYTRVVVAAAVIDALDSLELHYPTIDATQRAELAAARKTLLAEKPAAGSSKGKKTRKTKAKKR